MTEEKHYEQEEYYISQKDTPEGKEYYIYIYSEILEPRSAVKIIEVLDECSANDNVCIKLNTPGGRMDTTISIVDAIRNCEGFTLADLSGEVASAGTMIALACDGMYCAPYTWFMIHNFSGGAFGKGHEMYSQVDFYKKSMPKLFRDYYEHFLTPEEIDYVLANNDIHLEADDVLSRFTNVVAMREKEIERDQEAERVAQLEQLREYIKQEDAKYEKSTDRVRKGTTKARKDS